MNNNVIGGNKIYLCETGEIHCFHCVGKEKCSQYYYGQPVPKILFKNKSELKVGDKVVQVNDDGSLDIPLEIIDIKGYENEMKEDGSINIIIGMGPYGADYNKFHCKHKYITENGDIIPIVDDGKLCNYTKIDPDPDFKLRVLNKLYPTASSVAEKYEDWYTNLENGEVKKKAIELLADFCDKNCICPVCYAPMEMKKKEVINIEACRGLNVNETVGIWGCSACDYIENND